jgi:hypothetical protein
VAEGAALRSLYSRGKSLTSAASSSAFIEISPN